MFLNSNQVRQMQSMRETEYCEKIYQELRRDLSEQTAHWSDETLRNAVMESFRKGMAYGLTSGDGIRRFVRLAILVNPRFDEDPNVQRFLQVPDLEPDMKIKLLSQLVAQQILEKVS